MDNALSMETKINEFFLQPRSEHLDEDQALDEVLTMATGLMGYKRSMDKESSEYLAVTDMTVRTYPDKPSELVLATPVQFKPVEPQ